MYPKVNHKLPELFSVIIEHHDKTDEMIKGMLASKVITFDKCKELKEMRNRSRELNRAAEDYVRQAKKD